jgi:hypothetical protein
VKAIALQRDETRIFTAFTGHAEPDPHRVRFWRIVISAEGLTLEPTDAEAQRSSASWHDLHDMLGIRAELLEDLEEMRAECRQIQHDIEVLRTHHRRLKRIVQARRSMVEDPKVIDLSARLARVTL